MEIRRFEQADFEIMNRWYLEYNKPIPSSDWFTDGMGFVVEDDGKAICIGFLYFAGKARAYIEDFISSPDSNVMKRNRALNLLAETIEQVAKEQGVKYLIGYTINSHIIKRAVKLGYGTRQERFTAIAKILN